MNQIFILYSFWYNFKSYCISLVLLFAFLSNIETKVNSLLPCLTESIKTNCFVICMNFASPLFYTLFVFDKLCICISVCKSCQSQIRKPLQQLILSWTPVRQHGTSQFRTYRSSLYLVQRCTTSASQQLVVKSHL